MSFTTPFGSTAMAGRLSLSLWDGMLLGGLLFLFCYMIWYRRRRTIRNLWRFLLFVYLGAVVSLTLPILLPSGICPTASSFEYAVNSINWTPFQASLLIYHNCQAIGNMGEFIRIVGGNFVMLMPLAVLVPLLHPRIRVWTMFFMGAGVSISIEALQFLIGVLYGSPLRTVEIDDFLLNTAGCFLAYLLFMLVRRIFRLRSS